MEDRKREMYGDNYLDTERDYRNDYNKDYNRDYNKDYNNDYNEDYNHNRYHEHQKEDYTPYWETSRTMRSEGINSGAVIHGIGLALSITVIALVLGFIWAQAIDSAVLDYSFLVDITLAGSVLIGGYRGAVRAKSLGTAHGSLVGLGYSILGVLLLAMVAKVNWWGALETIVMAGFLGGLGGVVGVNLQATQRRQPWGNPQRRNDTWRSDRNVDFSDYDDLFTRQ